MGLFSRLFGRARARAPVAELPSAPATVEPEPGELAVAEPEPGELAVAAPEPDAPETGGAISPARLDAALQRLREEHPPAPE